MYTKYLLTLILAVVCSLLTGTDNIIAQDSQDGPVNIDEMIRTIHQDLYNKLENPPHNFMFFMQAERNGTVNIIKQHILDRERQGVYRGVILYQDIPILGMLQAVEAADVIVNYLDIEADYPGSIQPPQYPAIDALGKIGSPATPHILNAIAVKDRSDVFYENAATVLKGVYGVKVARIIVNDIVNAETDPVKKARLEKLLQSFPAVAESPAATEETSAPPPVAPTVEDLAKMLENAHLFREQVVEQIRDLLYNQERELDALKVIGQLHLTEFAPNCVRYLNAVGSSSRPSGDELNKAAARALVEMGPPAVPVILKFVADNGKWGMISDGYPQDIITKIYGEKFGLIVIKDAIAAEQDPQRKANLEKLLNPSYYNWHPQEPATPTPNPSTPQPATQEKPATEPTEEAAPPAQTVSPAPAAGFPWYASGIIGLVLGAAATFALTRKK